MPPKHKKRGRESKLVLKLWTLKNVVEIKAPMLRSFDFIGSIQYICFKNIPLLAKVSLIDNESSEKSRKCEITNFFKSFVVLENLKLNEASRKLFAAAAGGVPTRLPFDLKFFKYLRISSVALDQQGEILCALFLIRSCPYLEYMKIYKVCFFDEDSPALPCLELEGFSDVMFSHLKEVNLQGFLATKAGMQFIKLLLDKSHVLVRMLIKFYIDDYDHCQLYEYLTKTYSLIVVVNAFRCASPNAEVAFHIEYDSDYDDL
ncbi:uncharacterized protein [Solanum tuberosum]|uniref:uncharacterized protein n=1 Tax=Solanum tuberosum TaxID=4113 RepID=UPI00073A504A|nr:PREDICTED: uncharacterized protein LOC107062178 [Solanum tuberosum]